MASRLSLNPRTGLAESQRIAQSFLPAFNANAFGFALPDPVSAPTTGNDKPPGYGDFLKNFQSLIEGDPLYKQNLADLSAQGIGDASQRRAARQRALIQFGIVPDLKQVAAQMQMVGGDFDNDIDPLTGQLAAKNTAAGLSTKARLDDQHQKNVRAIRNALAARGLLRSGETGYQLGEEQRAYEQSNYDATQKLLDYLAGVQAAFAQSERSRQTGQANAAQAAAARQQQIWEATRSTPVAPTAPPAPVDEETPVVDPGRRSRGVGGTRLFAI